MLTRIVGEFVKITFADQAHLSLCKFDPSRPVARFNRKGQDALYLSPNEEAARVAIGEYVQPNDSPRVLVRYQITCCNLLDLRLPEHAALYKAASMPWQKPLQAGSVPPSWAAADEIRKKGIVGLIDPSRRRPGLWHITLFKWNEQNTPTVSQIGEPVSIKLTLNYR